MKHFILASLLIASNAYAGTTGGFTTSDGGIVTPNVARGMRAFDHYNSDTNGDMVVCFYDDYSRGECKGGWKLAKNTVPAGTTYVGFRIVSRSYGYRQIEIYWK